MSDQTALYHIIRMDLRHVDTKEVLYHGLTSIVTFPKADLKTNKCNMKRKRQRLCLRYNDELQRHVVSCIGVMAGEGTVEGGVSVGPLRRGPQRRMWSLINGHVLCPYNIFVIGTSFLK